VNLAVQIINNRPREAVVLVTLQPVATARAAQLCLADMAGNLLL